METSAGISRPIAISCPAVVIGGVAEIVMHLPCKQDEAGALPAASTIFRSVRVVTAYEKNILRRRCLLHAAGSPNKGFNTRVGRERIR